MCPQLSKNIRGRVGGQDQGRINTPKLSLPRRGPTPPAKAAMPLPPPPTPSPPPSPTLPPCPPTRAPIRRSCAGRGTSIPVKGKSRGGFPLWQGVWGMCPHPKNPRAGWAQPTSRRPKCGCRALRRPGALPCALFPFVGFSPFFTRALGPHSARALAATTCPPLSTFPTPSSGALGPPSGQCLAATTCPPLSTCPSRLKPKLHRVPPGTGRPEKTRSTIQSKSNRRSTKASEGSVIELLRGRGRRPAEAEGAGLALPAGEGAGLALPAG